MSVQSYGEKLDVSKLKGFHDLLLQETKDNPKNIFKYLSDALRVETNIGSSAQGLTLFYNKTEYINLITKYFEKIKNSHENQEVDNFDFKVLSSTKGEFTVKSYSKVARSTVWSTFTVKLVEDKIQIIKIVDAV